MRRAALVLAAVAVLALPTACGAGGRAAGCGLEGLARAGPPGAEILYWCWHDPRGLAANGDVFSAGTDGGAARRLTAGFAWDYDPAWSPDGSAIAFTSTRDGSPDLYLMRADGSGVRRLTSALAREEAAAWSPDGRLLAFASGRDGLGGPLGSAGRHASLFVLDLGTGLVRRVAGGPGFSGEPAWSPDGGRLAFVSDRAGPLDIWTVPAAGGTPRRLTAGGGDHLWPAWSPDGGTIAYQRGGTVRDPARGVLWAMRADGAGAHVLLPGEGQQPAWSPGGDWLAFVSTRGGGSDLWLLRAGGGPPVRLSHDGEAKFRPAWRPVSR